MRLRIRYFNQQIPGKSKLEQSPGSKSQFAVSSSIAVPGREEVRSQSVLPASSREAPSGLEAPAHYGTNTNKYQYQVAHR
jgi:hypothetical protein